MMSGVEELLRRTMGLEASSIGAATVEGIVRGRMAQIGVATTDDYLRRLHDTPAEMDELIEAVVIPESWFFRDGAPFTTLAGWVRERWLPTHGQETLRVLTIPCSTGEEPYSVAMTLLGAGLPPARFAVDAVDISQRALARAHRAVYGSNSFRGQALDFRDHYFVPTAGGHALLPEVRRQVRFEQGNILAADFRPGAGRFDVIFCRNLLIYFDRPTQTRAVQTLATMLASGGLLFVGHAEAGIAAAAGLATANYPMSFAFGKAAAASPPARTYPPVTAPATTRVIPSTPRFATPSVRTPRPAPSLPVPPKPAPLDTARLLADQGKLEDAARLCEDHLRQNSGSAAAWHLLGVVREAVGDRRRAAECYAKTLYLEPDHQEALLQRALLAEQDGDLAAAAQLRRRVSRVQGRSVTS